MLIIIANRNKKNQNKTEQNKNKNNNNKKNIEKKTKLLKKGNVLKRINTEGFWF